MNTLRVSFEVFPPKTEVGLATLERTARRLAAVDPVYISVTYCAGGSNRDKSFAAIDAVRAGAPDTPVAAHLTCVGQSVAEIDTIVDRYDQLGVEHIVALRGDPPDGVDAAYHAHPDGYQTTPDLVAAIAARRRFRIAVSAYPEVHPQSPDAAHDLDVLAAKAAAGATSAMTQMFFDNTTFLRYRDTVAARGIELPIVPGIFPIHSYTKVAGFAGRCGATMAPGLADAFCDRDDDHDLAADLAALQIDHLGREGVTHVHLYTLNRADLVLAVCERLGLASEALS